MLPNLIIIGAAKAGTTSLHHYLGVHPEVSMAAPAGDAEKEMRFFWRMTGANGASGTRPTSKAIDRSAGKRPRHTVSTPFTLGSLRACTSWFPTRS